MLENRSGLADHSPIPSGMIRIKAQVKEKPGVDNLAGKLRRNSKKKHAAYAFRQESQQQKRGKIRKGKKEAGWEEGAANSKTGT